MRKISFLFLLGSFTLFIYSCQKEQDCTCQNKESSSTEEKNSKGKSNDTDHNSSNERNDRIRPAYSYSLDQSTAWKMKWHDEFEGNQFNQQYWTKIPRGHSPWNKYMFIYQEIISVKISLSYYIMYRFVIFQLFYKDFYLFFLDRCNFLIEICLNINSILF